MGGQAFDKIGPNSDPPFTTPRISPKIYEQLKQITLTTVSRYYQKVVAIPDAPGKTSYGDVDLVVESPHNDKAIDDIGRELHVRHIIRNSPGYHLAIPRPDDISGSCAQLDILVCPPGYLEWTVFLHGYGDFGQILGVMNYGFGFTANDKGYTVRIKEQEAKNWKASQVVLTEDPGKVMDFLHLDKEQFAKGFESEQQLFDWVSKCRLLNRNLIEKRKDDSDDRQRMQKRPMFRRFISDYLPSLPTDKVQTTETRDSLLKAALTYFNKELEFTTRRNIVLADNAEDRAWRLIISTILAPCAQLQKDRLNETVRGFKRFTAFTADEPYIREDPKMVLEKQARFAVMVDEEEEKIKPDMRQWIMDHWEEVKGLERQRKKEASRR